MQLNSQKTINIKKQVDLFKEFIRKELIEKFGIKKNEFNSFKFELYKVFNKLGITKETNKIRCSKSFKRLVLTGQKNQ